jgi:hypothetical protein
MPRSLFDSKQNCQTLICALLLMSAFVAACNKAPSPPEPAIAPAAVTSSGVEPEFEQRLKTICEGAQGTVGLSIVHIESGKTISINGATQLPLYSVFKLPLAVAVLKHVEENRLRLDQQIHVVPEEIVPGTPENTALWQKPVDRTIEELIEFSISRSDNTSTEKLLQLAGGPASVTERMRSLGFKNLDIHSTISEYVKTRANPNTGAAESCESPHATPPGKDPSAGSTQRSDRIYAPSGDRFAPNTRKLATRHRRRRQDWFGRKRCLHTSGESHKRRRNHHTSWQSRSPCDRSVGESVEIT